MDFSIKKNVLFFSYFNICNIVHVKQTPKNYCLKKKIYDVFIFYTNINMLIHFKKKTIAHVKY